MGFFKSLFGGNGWERVPVEFVEDLKTCLGDVDFESLDELARKYNLFEQNLFQPETPGLDPENKIFMMSQLFNSLGNKLAQQESLGDAEKAFVVSLKLDPKSNMAHYSLVILYSETGRLAEARIQAKKALEVIDELEGSQLPSGLGAGVDFNMMRQVLNANIAHGESV